MRKSTPLRLLLAITAIASPILAQETPVIFRGKITMPDGSPPPKAVGYEKVCTEIQGNAPGGMTDKKGEFIWTMGVDPFKPRRCWIQSTSRDYDTTQVEISQYNGVEKNVYLDAIILYPKVNDPFTILAGGFTIPGKSKDAWNAALQALQTNDLATSETNLQKAVDESPKFSQGWHTMGIIQSLQGKHAEARKSFEKAIEMNPKYLEPQAALVRQCMRLKDFACVNTAAEAALKLDSKRIYPLIYVWQAGAKFYEGDMAAAEALANQALDPKAKSKALRGEYVLARIAMEKGDKAAAKQHLDTFLTQQSNASDLGQLKLYQSLLDNPAEAIKAAPEF